MLQPLDTRETREAARELRFLVTPAQAAEMIVWARQRLAPDPHGSGAAADQYCTTSVYFDTDALDVFHRRGSFKRAKFRIRRYDAADVVFVERKMRTSRLLHKRRTIVPLAGIRRLVDPLGQQESPANWFRNRLAARHLRPICQVVYHRTARVASTPSGPVRLTFDTGIRAQPTSAVQFLPESGLAVFEAHTVVEMKFRRDLPSLCKRLVEEFKLDVAPVSKYRAAMRALGYGAAPIEAAVPRVAATMTGVLMPTHA